MGDLTTRLEGKVRVVPGPAGHAVSTLIGRTVEAVLGGLREAFDIPHGIVALVNGTKVGLEYELGAGDTLELVKLATARLMEPGCRDAPPGQTGA